LITLMSPLRSRMANSCCRCCNGVRSGMGIELDIPTSKPSVVVDGSVGDFFTVLWVV